MRACTHTGIMNYEDEKIFSVINNKKQILINHAREKINYLCILSIENITNHCHMKSQLKST